MARTGSARTGSGGTRRKRRFSPAGLDWVPTWVQMGVAVLTLLLTVLVTFGVIGRGGQQPVESQVAGAGDSAVVKPIVSITAVSPDLNEIVGLGTFANVDLGHDDIFLIGQPKSDPEADWIAIRAEAKPTASSPGLASGDWRAHRPTPGVGFLWRAIVMGAGMGAADDIEDVRANGPEAYGVVAVSEAFETD